MTHFAREYGNALFELAREEQLAHEIMEQLSMLENCLAEAPDYIHLLGARSVELDARLKMIDEAFGGSVHPYLVNFLKIITERGAADRFLQCAQMYRSLYNDAYGIAEAVVTSAAPLTPKQQQSLVERLEKISGRKIHLHTRVNAALIGGMQVELEGRRYDNSIRTRLDSMRRILTESE